MSAAFRAVAGFIAPLLPWILAAAVGALLWTFTPIIGPSARMAKMKADSDVFEQSARDWRVAASGWESSFRSAEALRAGEQATANAAAASLAEQCAARVTEARQSARVIERIVTQEPTYDQNRCPVRERVDPRLLRDALTPGAGSD